MTEIMLPFPPSSNTLFKNRKGGRSKTPKYKAWIDEAGKQLMKQRPKKHIGPVWIGITIGLPDKRKRDLDNLIKPCLDILVSHQIIEDDSVEIVRTITIGINPYQIPGAAIYIEPEDAK